MPLASRLLSFGLKPPNIEVVDVPPIQPGPGEVLLRMLHAPINPADLNVIEGTYGELPALPANIGNEGVGEVVAQGEGVVGFENGQLALPLVFGTWRQEVVLPASSLIPLPLGLDSKQAAMLLVNPATAWRMIHDFVDLKPGDWIVQNAANSGVGRSVIQIARELGLRTLNIVRRPELIDELKTIGADVVVLEDANFRDRRSFCDGSEPKLGLNAIGGASALNVANALAPNATMVTYGAMSRQALKIPNGLLIFKNITFKGFWLRRWRQTASRGDIASTYTALANLLQKGILHTPVQKIFPFRDILSAVEAASQSSRPGKVLLDLRGT